ncbi:MAG TPA: SHOCT domain-containing protein [Candidatus Acidoferrales bacterium]|nr:SHOCT domain-containing protein [Candidatus Acidoferrales bacterium]
MMWPFWWFGRGLLWIVLIVVIIAVFRRPVPPMRPQAPLPPIPPPESAEDLLKKRYARGEISKEQYESTLADLRR